VFHTDVVKVDRDVAYVVMVVHVCCKILLSMLHLFFQAYVTSMFIYVAYVSHKCCKCFIWMLRMFYNGLQVFQMHVSSISSALKRCKCCPPPPPTPDGHPLPLTSLLDAGDVRGGSGPAWAHKMVRETDASACVLMPRLSGR
jgi:hypothetical protein